MSQKLEIALDKHLISILVSTVSLATPDIPMYLCCSGSFSQLSKAI